MGSDSDLPIVEKTIAVLGDFKVPFEVHVYSAHRTPDKVRNFTLHAEEKGFGVIICAAGKAAHLAGVAASLTTLPVIGLPIKSDTLDGLDSLLSTVQMPTGIPVATVAINGAKNAALLALQIIALEDESVRQKLKDLRQQDREKAIEKDAAMEEKYSMEAGFNE